MEEVVIRQSESRGKQAGSEVECIKLPFLRVAFHLEGLVLETTLTGTVETSCIFVLRALAPIAIHPLTDISESPEHRNPLASLPSPP